jgi:streptogramin lyase/sugar lactone lactonase YvrE
MKYPSFVTRSLRSSYARYLDMAFMLMGLEVRVRTGWTGLKSYLRTAARARGRNPRPWLESLETRALMASITEYPITVGTQSLGNGLVGITGGPDGNVYFTDTLNNAIGQITPSGAIKELPLPPANGGGFFKNGLDGITLGADNKLAFTESTQGAIGDITTTGSYNKDPIDSTGKSTGQGPDQITKASDGTLWWTEDDANSIGELTPAGVFHEYSVPNATHGGILGASMKGITIGSDGNVWFTSWGSSGDFIGMMNSAGQPTEYSLPFGTDPDGITSGPDNNLWFVAYGSNTIDVMSTSGAMLHQYPVSVAPGTGGLEQLEDITLGPDNNFYFTAQTGYIGEITTSGVVTESPVSTTVTTVPGASGPQPLAITSGPDGNIWFTDPWTDSIGVLRIAATSTPSPVTLYDATQIAEASNGALVTTLTDLSGNGNDAIKSSSAAAVGTYVTDGIGGLPSIQFASNGFISGDGTGYQSALNMGTALGISGDAAWTAIYVFRAAAPSQGDYSWVGSLGAGSTANAGALVEIDAVHPINGQSPHLDLATGFSDDAVLEPGNSYDQLAGKDLVLTVIHQGPGAGSIGNTIQMFVNGDSPGQGVLSGLTLGTTGNAATATLNLANEPFFLGGSPFGTGAGFNGLLSEALVYNAALTTTERIVIESQLMTKFGIASVPEPTSLALTVSTATASLGQSVTFTATVSDPSPGGATPTGGMVTFSDQNGSLESESPVNGVATFTTSSLAAGTHTVTASYSGTTGFAPSTTGTIVTSAGDGVAGYTGDGGPATAAELRSPAIMAFDSSGNRFIPDWGNHVVREVVKATGDIVTVAGNGTAGYSGDGGLATSAELGQPNCVAFDSSGDLLIADQFDSVIREVVKATGDIITVAGNGTPGYRGDGGLATTAELCAPNAVAVDSVGDLFIADTGNNVIREVVKATGDIMTVAGNGIAGYSGENGPATAAELNVPAGVVVDSAGDLFIADDFNNVVREVVHTTGDIITFAGNGTAGYTGDGGPATTAELRYPNGIAVDSVGDVFIGDSSNHRIREVVKATGDIITVAGNGTAGYSGDNGPATAAELNGNDHVAVDSEGELFIADDGNNVVRKVTPAVSVTIRATALPTLTALTASTASATVGQSVTFSATVSDLAPGGATPNGGTVTFSDESGALDSESLINGVATFTTSNLPSGTTTVTASYAGTTGFAPSTTGTIVTAAGDGTAGYSGDNGPATAAELNVVAGIAFDSAGNLFIADLGNNVVREVIKATGKITTVAGNGTAGYSGDNGPASAAELNQPTVLAFDSAGDLFIADANNNVVREVEKATGNIITVAGNGTVGYSGDNGPATSAELNIPFGLAFDTAGNLFITDSGNNVIREVVKASGNIVTFAGDGTAGYSGDGGPATAAELNYSGSIAFDAAGNLFIADYKNNVIREVLKATGNIITVAGNGTAGYNGDNVPATAAELNEPNDIAIDSAGDIFIADFRNNIVRELVKATGNIITVAGNGTTDYPGDGGPATAAGMNEPSELTLDSAGDLLFSDTFEFAVREITPAVTVTISPPALVIQTQPSSKAIAGQPFAVQPVIYVEDQHGNLETNDNSTVVTVTLATGDGPIQGTTSVTVQGGIATFNDLADNKAEMISLIFSSDIETTEPSTGINVSPAGPYQLLIHTQPSSTGIAGQPFAIQPMVYEVDRYGNLETGNSTTAITVSLASGNGPFLGTKTIDVVNGVAMFTDLSDNREGIISLSFSGAGMTAGPSNNIFISPANAANLVIQTQPNAQVTAGDNLTDPIVIDEEDKYGNIEKDDNSTPVTASLASGSGSLKGVKTVTVVAGVASFDNLKDDTAGTLTLKFAAGDLLSMPSNPTNVSPAAANKLVVVIQPSSNGLAGQAFTTQPVVFEEDQFGNLETDDNTTVISALIATGAGPLQGVSTVKLTGAVAAFTSLSDRTAESITLRFFSGSLTSPASSAVIITANAPTASLTIAPPGRKKHKSTVIMIQYSTTMDLSSASSESNYQLFATTGKGKKKKTTNVKFSPVFAASTNTVTLTVTSKKNRFATGGQLKIVASSPSGVKSLAGVFLSPSSASFKISPNANTITHT